MKINKFYFLIAFCLHFSACEKEEPVFPAFPPATQSGEMSLGCYVNGRALVHDTSVRFPFIIPFFTVMRDITYNSNFHGYHSLTISALGGFDDFITPGRFRFNITNPQEGVPAAEYEATFITTEKDPNYGYSGTYEILPELSEIVLTKLDTINNIVSGRFDMVGINLLYRTDTVVITDGRFDFKIMFRN